MNKSIGMAVKTLCNGGLVAFPTETVYGLGADAMNEKATDRIFQVKKRPRNHPLIVHVSSIFMAKRIVSKWPKLADIFASKFWPGPLTLVFKKNNLLPECVTAGQDTVAIRIPSHLTALALLNEFAKKGSGYVAAPSANIYGSLSNTCYLDVKNAMGGHLNSTDFILDGYECTFGVESTIVDFSSEIVTILRPGNITKNNINDFLNINLKNPNQNLSIPLVSGSSKKHYCPSTPLYVLNYLDIVKKVENLFFDKNSAFKFFYWGSSLLPIKSSKLDQEIAPNNALEYGKRLYLKLNDLDRKDYKFIFFESPPETHEWEAVNNRLMKAKS